MAEITKALLRAIRPEIDAALKEVAKRHGLKSLTCGHARYDPHAGTFSMKVEGLADGAIGKEASLYNAERAGMQLPPLGATFSSGGHVYAVAGMKRSGKILAARTDGKMYIFDKTIVRLLAQEAAKVAA